MVVGVAVLVVLCWSKCVGDNSEEKVGDNM